MHGVIYADRLDPFAAFTSDHLELISAVAAQTAVTVETVKAHKRLAREEVARANYSRFMPEYVVKQLLQSPDSFRLGGVNQTVTVLFADIRGFTRWSESHPPEEAVTLLNRYFEAAERIWTNSSVIKTEYTGDEIMGVFPAARDAVRIAQALRLDLSRMLDELGLGIGVGLHTGLVIEGLLGGADVKAYRFVGDTVNTASRLESHGTPGRIQVTAETAQRLAARFRFEPRGAIEVKGKGTIEACYLVGRATD